MQIHNFKDAPIVFGPFQGAVFCDLGYVWDELNPKELAGSAGFSFRFFPIYSPLYFSYDICRKEFWKPGVWTSNLYIRIAF